MRETTTEAGGGRAAASGGDPLPRGAAPGSGGPGHPPASFGPGCLARAGPCSPGGAALGSGGPPGGGRVKSLQSVIRDQSWHNEVVVVSSACVKIQFN